LFALLCVCVFVRYRRLQILKTGKITQIRMTPAPSPAQGIPSIGKGCAELTGFLWGVGNWPMNRP